MTYPRPTNIPEPDKPRDTADRLSTLEVYQYPTDVEPRFAVYQVKQTAERPAPRALIARGRSVKEALARSSVNMLWENDAGEFGWDDNEIQSPHDGGIYFADTDEEDWDDE